MVRLSSRFACAVCAGSRDPALSRCVRTPQKGAEGNLVMHIMLTRRSRPRRRPDKCSCHAPAHGRESWANRGRSRSGRWSRPRLRADASPFPRRAKTNSRWFADRWEAVPTVLRPGFRAYTSVVCGSRSLESSLAVRPTFSRPRFVFAPLHYHSESLRSARGWLGRISERTVTSVPWSGSV